MSHFTESLNPAQRQAVVNYEKPSLIVAGAGSGKTRVLTCRIAYMIENGVRPGSILALTFTNKAAREMRERIEQLVPNGSSRYIWMGTFHSIFYRILRTEAEKLGFTSDFTIYDSSNSESLLSSIIKGFNLNTDDYKPREIHSRISLAKNNLVTAEAYAANGTFAAEDRQRKRPEFGRIYLEYSRRCKQNNAMDFDDLLLYINILFRDFPEALEFYQKKFQYILVDEYQDTNYAQYLIIRRLSQGHSRVCVVGDDAQSIYSFRGAKIENILRFQNDFPTAEIFKLEQNYRSTQNIVNAANSIIAKNNRQIQKNVFSEKDEGEKIKVIKAYTDQEEAQLVAEMIRAAGRESDGAWSEIAVLYRNNSQSRLIEEALRRRDIPYRIYSGHSFYDRKEIKDMVAYFRLIVNPRDDEAFRRIINTPARGIGNVTLARIAELGKERNVSMWEVIESLPADGGELKAAGKRVREFVDLISSISLGRNEKTLYEFGLEVATRSGLMGSYNSNPSPESQSALENIGELLGSMQNFKDERLVLAYEEGDEGIFDGEPTIEEWLQNISLMTDMDKSEADNKNRVVLMTVHAAKGLEFNNVFIVGVEENLFPSMMSAYSQESLEEERRLFYVALTRARDKAVVSFAKSRFKWGNTEFCRPSRFINEIDGRFVDLPSDMDEDSDTSPIDELRKRFNEGGSSSGSKWGAGAGRQGQYGGASKQGGDVRTEYYKQGKQVAAPRGDMRKTDRPVKPVNVQPRPTLDSGKFKSVGSRKVIENDEARIFGSASSASGQGSAAQGSSARQSAGNYEIGMTVEHSKFGRGRITAIDDMGSDKKITVVFDNEAAGKKSLLSKYANLRIVE